MHIVQYTYCNCYYSAMWMCQLYRVSTKTVPAFVCWISRLPSGLEIPYWTFFNISFRVDFRNIQFFIFWWNMEWDIVKILQGVYFKMKQFITHDLSWALMSSHKHSCVLMSTHKHSWVWCYGSMSAHVCWWSLIASCHHAHDCSWALMSALSLDPGLKGVSDL